MTKFCPLCKKVLLEIGGRNDRDYICQTRVKIEGFEGPRGNVPHYEQRSESSYIKWIALPYKIMTFTDKDEDRQSSIYLLQKKTYNPTEEEMKEPMWKLIATTPEIHPDTPERLAKRIKLLVPFT